LLRAILRWLCIRLLVRPHSDAERSTPFEYDALKSSKTITLPEGDYDVFGDGSVVIKPAYGHTPGHSVLSVKLAKTGAVLLSSNDERRVGGHLLD
jgi:glyoxylase-like metal-dependent hydrolase (beta-lactamase superfamily II)